MECNENAKRLYDDLMINYNKAKTGYLAQVHFDKRDNSSSVARVATQRMW